MKLVLVSFSDGSAPRLRETVDDDDMMMARMIEEGWRGGRKTPLDVAYKESRSLGIRFVTKEIGEGLGGFDHGCSFLRWKILHGLIGLVRSQLPATPRKIRSCLFVIWGILWSFSEILHGLIGLVRSQLPATPRKIRSCLFVIWGILWSFSETRIHILVSSLVIRWDNTEWRSCQKLGTARRRPGSQISIKHHLSGLGSTRVHQQQVQQLVQGDKLCYFLLFKTRAVQKLIETLKVMKQIVLIISALQPGFIHLVNDLNGNYVIQKCLSNFGAEENKQLETWPTALRKRPACEVIRMMPTYQVLTKPSSLACPWATSSAYKQLKWTDTYLAPHLDASGGAP
ncbi:3-hydroxyacyl-CoA dehydratase PASTICCINO 2A [Triticum urartu]|uniref:Very-long-chain (3R)-3-hydroxyacyl-CoA dehydratase n=1 Tax=Triticum urartu TaxID=4572 RepID=M7YMG0_TRIUA|nr:3-hydroxyacyl-CoA dehydratase PASTICCINO 2A [Triticum urartu]